jgi:carboxyl-terminal processing protease
MSHDKKNPKYLLPIGLCFFMAIGILIGYSLSGKQNSSSKVNDIIEVINKNYVDKVDGEKLFEETISEMLHKLDPHSNYISPKEMKALTEQIQGEFGGIGVRFTLLRDTICVTNVIPGSPSEAAGVLAGDKIIAISKKSVASKKITNEKVMALLKGLSNTSVNVTLWRNTKKLNKTLVRGTIPIASIPCALMTTKDIGYLKIDQFSVTTAIEFKEQSQKLLNLGMKSMILDLRNNGGGVLQTAVEIVDEFLKEGATIVSTKGANVKKEVFKASTIGKLENIPLVVLINENSASASEIVAGALQDNDRAFILGRRSYGKGLVQKDITLQDKSNVRLTIARYYTPTGRCIQKPYTDDYEKYMNEETLRFEHGEQFKLDSSLLVDSLKFKTPKGKIVYGGGGIFPDVFLPMDTLGSSWYFTELRYSTAFQSFAFDFVANKRTKWKNPEQFHKTFLVDDKLTQDFLKYATKNAHIPFDIAGLSKSKKFIQITLKAEIARQIWTEEGYYRVINELDKEMQTAIRTLEKMKK